MPIPFHQLDDTPSLSARSLTSLFSLGAPPGLLLTSQKQSPLSPLNCFSLPGPASSLAPQAGYPSHHNALTSVWIPESSYLPQESATGKSRRSLGGIKQQQRPKTRRSAHRASSNARSSVPVAGSDPPSAKVMGSYLKIREGVGRIRRGRRQSAPRSRSRATKRHKCDKCEKSYPSRNNLRRHVSNLHL